MHLIESHCELQALLRSDKSCLRFVEAMTNADLRARKLPDRNQWMDRATQSLVVGPQLSQQIRTALRRAVEYCERELLQGTIMNNKLGACNFCVTRAGALEDGMAFTLGNTIFLPSTYLDRNGQQHFTRLCEVLIHEATHVVQRTHAKLTAKLVEDVWKFQPLSDFEFQQLVAANKHPRTNPDTIAQHYRLGDDAWMFCFDSNHPRSLTEGQNVSMNLYTGATHPAKFEHPYEAMAYMMPHAIIDGETSGFCAQEDPLLRAMYLALCAPGNRNFEQTGTCYSAKDLRALAKRKGDKRLRENRFRPDKPREWVDQEFTWLNSMDISAVMKQYEKADPTFQFLGVLPRDFAVLKNPSGKCVIANTCNFDAGSVFRKSKSKVRRIGMVINLDKWGQGGSHWVALLIDMKRRAIMYYDSTTDPPHRDILVFMQQQRRAISNALRIDMDMQYNTVERQFKNTECGIFAMTFLAMMLETKLTFQEVCHIMPRDADIHMLRSVFYV